MYFSVQESCGEAGDWKSHSAYPQWAAAPGPKLTRAVSRIGHVVSYIAFFGGGGEGVNVIELTKIK